MQIHQLQPKHHSKSKKRVGRGGKKGTYSGKGGKGQTARSGTKMVPMIRELIKRYPKLKGYRAFVLQSDLAVINLDALDKNTQDNETINPEVLKNKGMIHMVKGKLPHVKILGNGKISKKLIIENCKVSSKAREAIEKAGGTVK